MSASSISHTSDDAQSDSDQSEGDTPNLPDAPSDDSQSRTEGTMIRTVTSSGKRWAGLSSAVSLVYAASLPIIMILQMQGSINIAAMPDSLMLLYQSCVFASVLYALGKDTFGAARDRFIAK